MVSFFLFLIVISYYCLFTAQPENRDVSDLIPQYDCPTESVYLPATTWTYSILGNIQHRFAITTGLQKEPFMIIGEF